jgi:hypothetical protein
MALRKLQKLLFCKLKMKRSTLAGEAGDGNKQSH